MSFFKGLGQFMMTGARIMAKWEVDNANTILRDRKRLAILGLMLLPIIIGGIAFAEHFTEPLGDIMPDVLGGHKAYSPAFYNTTIFIVSILIGLGAGLITGCIGAGGGFIIAPALMSAGIKGILAVGTDLFHIFAKAIMGSVIHRKLGNVSVPLAAVFLLGAIIGATAGGLINRFFYEINPVLSDAFITTVYSGMLGFLGLYAMTDFLRARKAIGEGGGAHGGGDAHGGKVEGADMANLPKKLQAMKIPPMVKFDFDYTPGGRGISWVFLVISGALVGLAAGIMGVGGGFLTFPIFVYVLGVSSMTSRLSSRLAMRPLASMQSMALFSTPWPWACSWDRFWASRSAPWSPRSFPASPSEASTPWPCWQVLSIAVLLCRASWGPWGIYPFQNIRARSWIP
jgi:uncharacterized membrane protein YfcA